VTIHQNPVAQPGETGCHTLPPSGAVWPNLRGSSAWVPPGSTSVSHRLLPLLVKGDGWPSSCSPP